MRSKRVEEKPARVYAIIDDEETVLYIGETTDDSPTLAGRWGHHRWWAKKNDSKPLHVRMRERGIHNCSIVPLTKFMSESKAKALEEVVSLKVVAAGYELLNGKLGSKMSEDAKQRIRDGHANRTPEQIAATKQRMRQAHLIKKATPKKPKLVAKLYSNRKLDRFFFKVKQDKSWKNINVPVAFAHDKAAAQRWADAWFNGGL